MILRLLIILLVTAATCTAGVTQSVQIAGADQTLDANTVELRGLDTLNGTTSDITVKVGDTVRFGHLEISVGTCRVPRSDPAGDAYVFLSIRDIRESEPRFSGWMFASSPALSALDHPRYDVWVESCSNS
jgi:hypothetical protein